MKREDIEVGATYLLRTNDPERKHLDGKPFTVTEAYPVTKYKRRRGGNLLGTKWRYFNEDGVGVPAEELEELPAREFPCDQCPAGEYVQEGFTSPSGRVTYQCNSCGHRVTFP